MEKTSLLVQDLTFLWQWRFKLSSGCVAMYIVTTQKTLSWICADYEVRAVHYTI